MSKIKILSKYNNYTASKLFFKTCFAFSSSFVVNGPKLEAEITPCNSNAFFAPESTVEMPSLSKTHSPCNHLFALLIVRFSYFIFVN